MSDQTKVFGSSYLPTVETVEHVKVFTGIGVVGLWLLFVYIFSIWLVLGTLSSHQFQDQIRRDSRNIEASETQSQLNKSQTVASIVRLLDSYETGQLSRQITNQEFQNTEERINEVSNEIDSEQVKSDKLWAQYDSAVDKTKREFIRSGGQFLGPESQSPNADLVLSLAQRAFPDDQPLMKLVESAGDALFKWNETNDNISRLENSLVKLKNRRKDLIGRLEVLRDEENKLFKSERERDYISELLSLNDFGFAFLATMPTQLLTLILTLSMGALGSVIYLTRTFFDRRTAAPFSFYLFRPFLGMVTAVAIFVLAKAGQISISDASLSQGNSENLNPFLISFLAVLSGLFSEHAYERIQKAGWAIFRSGDNGESKDRWAYRVQAEINAQGKDKDELVKFLRVPPEAIGDWLDEKQMVPEDAQNIIAAWLGRERRELFSDQGAAEIQSP